MGEAMTASADQAAVATEQYLTFVLAGEEYGVDILRVQEIKGWDRTTHIVNAPDYVLGVINLRGVVMPILDLRRRFGLETVGFGPTTVVIVLRASGSLNERTVGIVVDAVSEVRNVGQNDIKPPPEVCGDIDSIFVKSLAIVDKKMLILLDVDRLIGSSLGEERALGAVAA
jgi:purine-binding chemotaxis protein CheW